MRKKLTVGNRGARPPARSSKSITPLFMRRMFYYDPNFGRGGPGRPSPAARAGGGGKLSPRAATLGGVGTTSLSAPHPGRRDVSKFRFLPPGPAAPCWPRSCPWVDAQPGMALNYPGSTPEDPAMISPIHHPDPLPPGLGRPSCGLSGLGAVFSQK